MYFTLEDLRTRSHVSKLLSFLFILERMQHDMYKHKMLQTTSGAPEDLRAGSLASKAGRQAGRPAGKHASRPQHCGSCARPRRVQDAKGRAATLRLGRCPSWMRLRRG